MSGKLLRRQVSGDASRVARAAAKVLAGKLKRNPKRSLIMRKGRAPELRYADVGYFDQTLTGSTATIYSLSAVAEGDDLFNRQGRRIQPVGLQIKCNILQSNAAVPTFIRIVVFKDACPAGVQPTAGQLLQNGGESTSPFNGSYRDRFKILMDEYVLCSNLMNHPVAINKYFKLFQKDPTSFIGTGSSDASLGMNHYFIMFLADTTITYAAGAAGTRAGLDIYSRFSFQDY